MAMKHANLFHHPTLRRMLKPVMVCILLFLTVDTYGCHAL